MDASNYGSKHDHQRFLKLFADEVNYNKGDADKILD